MLLLAFTIGIFSYAIFFLGILHSLYWQLILICTVVFILFIILLSWNNRHRFHFHSTKKEGLILSLIIIQGIINLIGVFGPELSFDALWYHLTLPKIYLENHAIFHIPGGLFYYSDMPKNIEMLYIVTLVLGNEIVAKFIHFLFGVLTLIVLYKLSRKFLSQFLSLLVVAIFYSNLVVGWESITAYIDLGRTFFEACCLLLFIEWVEEKKKKYIPLLGILIGFTIATKLIAVSSLFMYILLVVWVGHKRKVNYIREVIIITFTSLMAVSPWLIFSYINTGNLVYPLFTNYYQIHGSVLALLNPINFIIEFAQLFLFSSDPVNPLYIILFPFIMGTWKKLSFTSKLVVAYCLLAILAWYITPRTGGGRFILPYLPALSLVMGILLEKVKNSYIRKYTIGLAIALLLISILYRTGANAKYLSVVLGKETRNSFLSKNLNYQFGDYYDIDKKIEKIVKKDDKVLIIGGHNLYYVNFPFTHMSYVKKNEAFNYIMTIDANLPERFNKWENVYQNDITKVRLYYDNGKIWKY